MAYLSRCYRFLLIMLFSCGLISIEAQALELLSESAMENVSGTLSHRVDEKPARDDGYESLPFESKFTIEEGNTNEVSTVLEFSSVKEVDEWADKLRENRSASLQRDTIESLHRQQSNIDFTLPDLIEDGKPQEGVLLEVSVSGNDEPADYLFGRVERSVAISEATANSIRVITESFVERAATINADAFQDGGSIGSVYISNIRSYSNILTTQRP